MKIYVDVTNLMAVNFVTGIQRVVREIVLRMIKDQNIETVLITYSVGTDEFNVLDNEKFYRYFKENEGEKDAVYTTLFKSIRDMEAGSVFFDLDSVWNSPYKRSLLLPELKGNGIKLAVYIYDIIPVTHPQYCHTNTIFNFLDYIGAYLQYTDIVIASAKSTLDAINQLAEELGLKPVKGYVSWLGSDFSRKKIASEKADPEIERIIKKGDYILTVGTIEPRKNHKILLDAFDNGLFDDGINLVFAGRIGWNVDELEKRIKTHPQYNKKLFLLSGLNDSSIDSLYRKAYLVAFPTYNEGFGLPMIEAFERGTPVVASDCKVLKEVGRDYCRYFDPDQAEEFVQIIRELRRHPEEYLALKNRLKTFIPFTWDQAYEKILTGLRELNIPKTKTIKTDVKQMVILTARCNDVIRTLPFVEAFMPFIKEIVLCCPDHMTDEFQSRYTGGLKVHILTDSMAVKDAVLPSDHVMRNFFLRSYIMRHELLDDVFIMSDDDYRPMQNITLDTYIQDGRYMGYYCYNLNDWKGTAGQMSSYDLGMARILDFLKRHHYPEWQYSSHMPQIIDKERFVEFLDKHPGVESMGVDEWSTYFNWLQNDYPYLLKQAPYVTMGWPGSPTDWKMQVIPEACLFENFYDELYEKGGIFEGFSKEYVPGIEDENNLKRQLYLKRQEEFLQYEKIFSMYESIYKYEHRETPSFVLQISDKVTITCPSYLVLCAGGFIRLPISVSVDQKRNDGNGCISFSYRYASSDGELVRENNIMNAPIVESRIEMPLWANIKHKGELIFTLIVEVDNSIYEKSIPLMLI